jgi:hypothetical protein
MVAIRYMINEDDETQDDILNLFDKMLSKLSASPDFDIASVKFKYIVFFSLKKDYFKEFALDAMLLILFTVTVAFF